MLIELHGLGVTLLRVGKEIALHVLPRNHAENRLRGNALVNVQRHRLDLEPRLLALAAPFQPRLVFAERGRQCLRFVIRKHTLSRSSEQFGKRVGFGGSGELVWSPGFSRSGCIRTA